MCSEAGKITCFDKYEVKSTGPGRSIMTNIGCLSERERAQKCNSHSSNYKTKELSKSVERAKRSCKLAYFSSTGDTFDLWNLFDKPLDFALTEKQISKLKECEQTFSEGNISQIVSDSEKKTKNLLRTFFNTHIQVLKEEAFNMRRRYWSCPRNSKFPICDEIGREGSENYSARGAVYTKRKYSANKLCKKFLEEKKDEIIDLYAPATPEDASRIKISTKRLGYNPRSKTIYQLCNSEYFNMLDNELYPQAILEMKQKEGSEFMTGGKGLSIFKTDSDQKQFYKFATHEAVKAIPNNFFDETTVKKVYDLYERKYPHITLPKKQVEYNFFLNHYEAFLEMIATIHANLAIELKGIGAIDTGFNDVSSEDLFFNRVASMGAKGTFENSLPTSQQLRFKTTGHFFSEYQLTYPETFICDFSYFINKSELLDCMAAERELFLILQKRYEEVGVFSGGQDLQKLITQNSKALTDFRKKNYIDFFANNFEKIKRQISSAFVQRNFGKNIYSGTQVGASSVYRFGGGSLGSHQTKQDSVRENKELSNRVAEASSKTSLEDDLFVQDKSVVNIWDRSYNDLTLNRLQFQKLNTYRSVVRKQLKEYTKLCLNSADSVQGSFIDKMTKCHEFVDEQCKSSENISSCGRIKTRSERIQKLKAEIDEFI